MGGSLIVGVFLYDYFLSRAGFSLEKVLTKSMSALIVSFAAGALLCFINEHRYRKNQADDL